jgi:DNA repair photolyase
MRSLTTNNPPNRFAESEVVYVDGEDGGAASLEVHFDNSASVLAKNDSPDLGFDYSCNPYRGCFHGCAYCYARPTHEYLSFGAGTDFERKIVVKRDAPALLRKAFSSKTWRGDLVMFSGVTDCYQPLESRYKLTRGCLEVCVEHANPAHVITKSPLIERDIDVLVALRRVTYGAVAISLPFMREDHARALEPFVTTPARRLRVIERLAKAGVHVGVMVAPVIPGLSDEELPSILEAARSAGASFCGYVLLRLPGAVKDVFESRLRTALPEKADRVMSHVREANEGKLYDSTFGTRGRGRGPYAEAIANLFGTVSKRLGFEMPQRREEGASGVMAPIPQLSSGRQLPLFR